MRKRLRIALGSFTVFLLALMPSVVPVGGSVAPASAAACSPAESTFTGNGAIGTSGVVYQVLRFSSVGECQWTVPTGVTTAEVLVVAGGGGGGGASWTGGGGAGGVLHRTDAPVSSVIAITVGGGGLAGSGNSTGGSGGNSLFGTVTALGGGGGGAYSWSNSGTTGQGSSGGSGGGSSEDNSALDGGASTQTAPTGWTAYGNAGGAMSEGGGSQAGSGGGGAGDPGGAVPAGSNQGLNHRTAGDGGVGRQFDITGSNVFYAGGGGGGTYNDAGDTCSTGGSGGGGAGACHSTAAVAGTNGLGGGGGGAWSNNSAAGGSGVVIVRYATVQNPSIAAGPSDASVDALQTATFSATASSPDTGALTYQWQQSTNSGSSWSNISGATSASYTTPALDATDSGDQFRVIVRNTVSGNFAEATSSAATLTVSRVSQALTWTQPTSLVLANSGDSATAATTSGDGSISYSVVSAGTTGCAINSSTGVLTFSGTGTCSVKADAAQTNTYSAASTTVSVIISQGTIAVSGPSSKVGTSSSSFTNVCTSSCDVTGFASGDQVMVVVSKSDGSALSGEVKLGSTTGLTQSLTGYQVDATQSGLFEIAFEGTQAEVNAALETLQYKSPAGGGDETIGISASLAGAAYFAGTGHYYEFVSSTTTWALAKTGAASRTFNGLTGYLATVTSLAENQFITSKVGRATAWLSGTDSGSEGTWKWDTGPEAGDIFWTGTGSSGTSHNTDDPFTYWGSSEPNQSGDEDCLEIISGGSGRWNDIPCSASKGYVIEYGGDGGTVLKQASTTFDVGAPTAPLQVTGLSVTAGDTKLTLSWTAPGSGGSAITDYVVEQSIDGGSTWSTLSDGTSTATSFVVTGLTNGSSYSFRVSATNAIGTGTVSSSASGTPAVPPTAPSGGGGASSPVSTPSIPVVVPQRVIVPPQPTSIPRVLAGPVVSPGRGFDPNAGTRATIGGAPATVTKRPLDGGGVSVQAGAFQLGINLGTPQPSNTPGAAQSDVTVPTGQSTRVNGGGLLPGSQLQVWLPGMSGTTPKELARIPVKADGTFESELSFTARQSETPIPIGRQVMQVTGYDEDGNQTVVDMTINIGQGAPTPEQNKTVNALPDLNPGQSLATSAGLPEIVTIEARVETREVAVLSGEWSFTVALPENAGVVEEVESGATLTLIQARTASVSGDGFQPDTRVDIWLFSDPTLLGSVIVSADGSFTGEVYLDARYAIPGDHTLQLQGVADDGFIKAANLGVVVQEPLTLTSESATGLLWWVLIAVVAVLVAVMLIVIVRRRLSRSGI
ncbi:fibronectin type III domain-containing protein [Pontimonas sp.]|nr:fibronectin type III domain-containing protein [Pontimonas sp.]